MAIKYVHIPEQRKTVALLEGTRYDAVCKISKVLANTKLLFDPDKYVMNNTYRAVVVCSDDDVYSPEEGERIAKKKLMARYYKAFDKRMDAFQNDLNEAMFQISSR